MTKRIAKQAMTKPASTVTIMRDPFFACGLDDIRKGKPFDPPGGGNDDWAYERGRLFGAIAPLSMPLKLNGKINPKAVALFDAAFSRRLII